MSQQELKDNCEHAPMKTYDTRELVLSKDILAKAKELGNLLAGSEEVETYQKAEIMIEGNERIQTLIKSIKKKQKEIVGFEYFKNAKMVAKIESEMKVMQDELDAIPLVQQFQQNQTDINYMLQLVVSVIKDTLSETIQVESGTDVPPTNCNDE